jgi:hypothetical protein
VAKKPDPTATVVPLFRRGLTLDGVPEVPMAVVDQPGMRPMDNIATKVTNVDLSDWAKVWFLIGRGNSGKTAFARWLVHNMTEDGGSARLAAIDPGNRSLSTWFDNVLMPPATGDAHSASWLREFLEFLMTSRSSAIVDLGGGDQALAKVLEAAPTMPAALEAAGLAPVAAYLLSQSPDDLFGLQRLEAMGFKPRATIILLNAGLGDPTIPREERFALVVRHSIFQAAVARGAVVAWMPGLESDVMQEIEAKRLDLAMARDGQVPEGAGFYPIGGLRRSMVGRWLGNMSDSLEPVRTWLP